MFIVSLIEMLLSSIKSKFSVYLSIILIISLGFSIPVATFIYISNYFVVVIVNTIVIFFAVIGSIIQSQNLYMLNIQDQSYRRLKKNKHKIFVKYHDGWEEYHNHSSLNTAIERLSGYDRDFEIGGYSVKELKVKKRLDKLKQVAN